MQHDHLTPKIDELVEYVATENPKSIVGQIPQTTKKKLISTAGQDGDQGSRYTGHQTTASNGDGADGRYADSPSHGRSAVDTDIYLNYQSNNPSYIQVKQSGHAYFKLTKHDWLMLDVHGGNGGDGGWGEHGKHGSIGHHGANAAQFRDGGDGGCGGDGGNGGYGTHGANGGSGGYVHITVVPIGFGDPCRYVAFGVVRPGNNA